MKIAAPFAVCLNIQFLKTLQKELCQRNGGPEVKFWVELYNKNEIQTGLNNEWCVNELCARAFVAWLLIIIIIRRIFDRKHLYIYIDDLYVCIIFVPSPCFMTRIWGSF